MMTADIATNAAARAGVPIYKLQFGNGAAIGSYRLWIVGMFRRGRSGFLPDDSAHTPVQFATRIAGRFSRAGDFEHSARLVTRDFDQPHRFEQRDYVRARRHAIGPESVRQFLIGGCAQVLFSGQRDKAHSPDDAFRHRNRLIDLSHTHPRTEELPAPPVGLCGAGSPVTLRKEGR